MDSVVFFDSARGLLFKIASGDWPRIPCVNEQVIFAHADFGVRTWHVVRVNWDVDKREVRVELSLKTW